MLAPPDKPRKLQTSEKACAAGKTCAGIRIVANPSAIDMLIDLIEVFQTKIKCQTMCFKEGKIFQENIVISSHFQ